MRRGLEPILTRATSTWRSRHVCPHPGSEGPSGQGALLAPPAPTALSLSQTPTRRGPTAVPTGLPLLPPLGGRGSSPSGRRRLAVGVPGSASRQGFRAGVAPGGCRVRGWRVGLVFGVCPCLLGAGSLRGLPTPLCPSPPGHSFSTSLKAPGSLLLALDLSCPCSEELCPRLPWPWSAQTPLPSRSCTARGLGGYCDPLSKNPGFPACLGGAESGAHRPPSLAA